MDTLYKTYAFITCIHNISNATTKVKFAPKFYAQIMNG